VGWSWASSQVGPNLAEEAEQEVERRRKRADACYRDLQNAEASLASLSWKSLQVHELAEALSNSLKALSSLGTDIKSMLTEFNEMKTNMEELVKRHQVKLDEIVGDSEPVNSFDIGQLRRDSLEMKKCAIIVEHLAWLYAEIIRQVMIQGLERMRTTTQLSGNHDANPVPSASSGSGQPLMLQDDSFMTSVVSAAVDYSFRGRFESMESLERSSSSSSSRPRFWQSRSSESKDKTKSRSIFSKRK
jgi:hypothetical protein